MVSHLDEVAPASVPDALQAAQPSPIALTPEQTMKNNHRLLDVVIDNHMRQSHIFISLLQERFETKSTTFETKSGRAWLMQAMI